MKFSEIKATKGLIRDISPRHIPIDALSEATNISYILNAIIRRCGCNIIGSNLPLSGRIMGFKNYDPFVGLSSKLLAFTTRDAYWFDSGADLWKFLTKNYATGTVTVAGNAADIVSTVATGTWDDTNWDQVSIYEIKYGVDDPNDDVEKTGCTWSSGATQLTAADVTDIVVGQVINGMASSGIPQGTRVTSASGTTIYLSETTTAAEATGKDVTFTCPWHVVESIESSTTANITPEDTINGSISTGTATLTLDDTTGLYKGQICAHASIPNGTVINSVDSSTQVTVSQNATGDVTDEDFNFGQPAAVSSKYVLRLCFSGDEGNLFSIATPVDEDTWDMKVAVTNGTDPIQLWDGQDTTFFEDITDCPEGAKVLANYASGLWAINITDAGDSKSQSMVRSAVGDPDDWSSWYGYNLYGTDDPITGAHVAQSIMFVTKRKSICAFRATGSDSQPFVDTEKFADEGTPAQNTGFVHENVLFYVTDKGLSALSTTGNQQFPEGMSRYIGRIKNDDKFWKGIVYYYQPYNALLFFLPVDGEDDNNICYAYFLDHQRWAEWTFPFTVTAFGEFLEQSDVETWEDDLIELTASLVSSSMTITVDSTTGIQVGMAVATALGTTGLPVEGVSVVSVDSDTTFTVSSAAEETKSETVYVGWPWSADSGSWEDLLKTSKDLSYCIGDSDGNVYHFSSQYGNDNGTDIDAVFETSDYPQAGENQMVLFQLYKLGFIPKTGELLVSFSNDSGDNWSEEFTIDQNVSGSYSEAFVNFLHHARDSRVRVQNVSGSDFEIEQQIFGYEIAGNDRLL